jgi:ubiquinone/menaquinone biosynthesis C-methylase UbiE
MRMPDDAFAKWAEFYRSAGRGRELLWPSETLIRCFAGDYIPGFRRDFSGETLLDVGFGNGNNLVYLATLGFALYGTEVTPAICEQVREKLGTLGQNAELRVGTNRALPFADAAFDVLTSWNVIHYEDNENDMRAAIAEYARVLKPGGRFIVSTTGPEHKILNGSESLGGHRYRIGRSDDHRRGQVFFYFDTASEAQGYFAESFDDVHVGRTHDMLFTETLDWFIVTGRARSR